MPKDEFLKPEALARGKERVAPVVKPRAKPAGPRKMDEIRPTGTQCKERGIALLVAMLVIVTLSGLALSMVLLTESQIRLAQTLQARARAYYAAMAGLEEARGRMNGSAPDTIASSLPTTLQQVFYLVNASATDPVQPTNLTSPYYDSEYAQEFGGGFGSATVLPYLNSDQPGAATSTSIPYKWVRITLKTTGGTSRLYWDGTQETPTSTGGTLVYVLTALAVDYTKVRKILQIEVAGTPGVGGANYTPVAAVAAAGSVSLYGSPRWQLGTGSPNVTVTGIDNNQGTGGCPAPTGALPGVLAGGTVTTSDASADGSPTTQSAVTPFPQSAATLISQYQSTSSSITSVDPSHVTSSGTGYVANGTTLGTQPTLGSAGSVRIVYSGGPLSITGSGNSGYGVLLVNGNLTVTGSWNYQGVTIVNGGINFTAPRGTNIQVSGTLIASGNVSLNASASYRYSTIRTLYNSCIVSQVLQGLSGGDSSGLTSSTTSPQTLAYRELSF
jgi:hypothetical protein